MASHTLIAGVSQSGKSTLARMFSRALLEHKKRVVVFDPTLFTATAGGDWGTGAEIYTDPAEFLDALEDPQKVSNAHVFIDEADEIFSHQQKENFWILKKGRHFGLSVWVITQRPKMVAPTVRNQCTRAFLFRLAIDDVKEIAADFGYDGLHKIPLDKGQYLELNSGSPEYKNGDLQFSKPSQGKAK